MKIYKIQSIEMDPQILALIVDYCHQAGGTELAETIKTKFWSNGWAS